MADAMKPCRWCDGTEVSQHSNGDAFYWVQCNDERCLAEGPIRTTETDAIAAWNRRAPLAPPTEREVDAEEGLAKAVPLDGMVATAARKLLGDQSNGVGLKRPDDPPPVPPQPAVYGGTANHLTVPLDAPVPPAPPQPTERVEAWVTETTAGGRTLFWLRAHAQADALHSGDSIIYLTTFPGVHDAASAEAFERAVRGLHDAAHEGYGRGSPELDEPLADLASYLPKEPPR